MTTNWPKCPKCRKQNVEIIELWKDHGISWQPGDPMDEGLLHEGGPYKVEGHCFNCKHRWTMRETTQIKEEWFKEEQPT